MNCYENLYISNNSRKWYRANETREYEKTDALKSVYVKNGIILPAKAGEDKLWALGGVLTEDLSFVETSKTRNLFGGSYLIDSSSVIQSDDEVVYMGPFVSHWGHFLCDQISRLWFILPNVKKYKIAYCGWNWGDPHTQLWGNYLELMLLLGLTEDQLLDIQHPTQFRNIIIPDCSFEKGKFYHREFQNLCHTIRESACKEDFEYSPKVYFTRRLFGESQKKERGEKAIEDLFRANGYLIVAPESISLSNQIFYFKYSKEIVAISGSIPHGIMFAGSEVEITILNKTNALNEFQLQIDRMTQAQVSYVDVFLTKMSVCYGLGPFLIGRTKYLKHYFKRKKLKWIRFFTADNQRKIIMYLWFYQQYIKIYSRKNNRNALQKEMNEQKNIKKSLMNLNLS